MFRFRINRLINKFPCEQDLHMAKKRGPRAESASQKIRDFIAGNPKAGPAAIQAALMEQGVNVSKSLINNIKYSKPKAAVKGRRGRKGKTAAVRAGGTNGAAAATGQRGEKADAVRGVFQTHGLRTRTRIVVQILADQGIAVSPAQVSKIKQSLRSKRRLERAMGRAVGSKPAHATIAGAVSVRELIEAKGLVTRLGGIARTQHLLDVLHQLQ